MAAKKKKVTTDESVKEEKVKKPKAIGPYDIIKMMFTDADGFDKLSDFILSRNHFMINRIFAIQYPVQAQLFNGLETNPANVIKSWRTFTVNKYGYGRVPGFVYTKSGKNINNELTANIPQVSNELKKAYCMHYQISYKDFDDMMLFYPVQTNEHVTVFDKIFNNTDKTQITKITD